MTAILVCIVLELATVSAALLLIAFKKPVSVHVDPAPIQVYLPEGTPVTVNAKEVGHG